MAERVFLIGKAKPIPATPRRWVLGLSAAAATGLQPLASGLWAFDVVWTILGVVLTPLPKMSSVDRMIWLQEVMKGNDPTEENWLL